jgi:copper oxidase (laccase) domain-containing protein
MEETMGATAPITEFFFSDKRGSKAVTVATFGGNASPTESALLWCQRNGCRGIDHTLSPPSRYSDPGFREIIVPHDPHTHYVDGMGILEGMAIGIRSKDCPIVVLFDTESGTTVGFHAGRPALTPVRYNHSPHHSVVDAGMEYLYAHGAKSHRIHAYVTAGICPQCFLHDTPSGQKLAAPFVKQYGERVIGLAGELDLALVIQLQLESHGIREKNITFDRNCTREHPLFASHRNGDRDSNMVVIVRQ